MQPALARQMPAEPERARQKAAVPARVTAQQLLPNRQDHVGQPALRWAPEQLTARSGPCLARQVRRSMLQPPVPGHAPAEPPH